MVHSISYCCARGRDLPSEKGALRTAAGAETWREWKLSWHVFELAPPVFVWKCLQAFIRFIESQPDELVHQPQKWLCFFDTSLGVHDCQAGCARNTQQLTGTGVPSKVGPQLQCLPVRSLLCCATRRSDSSGKAGAAMETR